MRGDGRLPGGRGGGPRSGGGRHRRAAPSGAGGAPGLRARWRAGLDGPWIVRGDRAGRGEALGWRTGDFAGRRITLPFSPNARHVRGAGRRALVRGLVAWYRTDAIVPRAGDYAIRFESVNHRARLFVDGHLAAQHTGTYLPFEARVASPPATTRWSCAPTGAPPRR